MRIYGEFFIDDFNYKHPHTNEPNEIGVGVGIVKYLKDFPINYIWVEYRAVTAWVYNWKRAAYRLLFYGKPFGNSFGNDGDKLMIKLCRFNNKKLFEIDYEILRKGEGEITDTWPSYFPDNWFLTGQEKITHTFDFKLVLLPRMEFKFSFEIPYKKKVYLGLSIWV